MDNQDHKDTWNNFINLFYENYCCNNNINCISNNTFIKIIYPYAK